MANDNVFLSSNNGASWTPASTGLPSAVVQAFAVSPNGTGGTNIFAGTYGAGVYLSTNSGTSWTTAGLTNDTVTDFAVSGTNLFTATYGGVFLSTNYGTSWTAVNSGLIEPSDYSLVVNGTNLFAASELSGVWRRPLSEMITAVKENATETPEAYSLFQNYPNPFNPTTVIGYKLAVSSHVTLKVYDILGREVTTMVNERQIAGNHSVTFSAVNLPSGVYFYRLQAGSFSETKKLLLLK